MAVSDQIRQLVAERASFRCEYCQAPSSFSPGPFAVEHIHPQALGGSDDPENLGWACSGCNGAKGVATEAVDPATSVMAPLFHPRKHLWAEHFAWEDDFLRVRGLTATGRATVVRLHINREELVNLRRILVLAGLHPSGDE